MYLPFQCPHSQGEGAVKQNADRCRQGGMKTDNNIRTSFMDDPICVFIMVYNTLTVMANFGQDDKVINGGSYSLIKG